MIDEDFIIDLKHLMIKKRAMQLIINNKFEKMHPRIEEMRAKYKKALEELYLEFDRVNYFEGFPATGWRKVKSIDEIMNYYYEVILVSSPYGNNDESLYEKEVFKIPYDEKDDADFVAVYKELRKQLYLKNR